MYSNIGKHSGKRKKRYVDRPMGGPRLTCIIYGPGYSSGKCKVLDYFGTKYAKGRNFNERSQDPTSKEKFEKNQEVNDVAQHSVIEIILHENGK